MAKIVLDNIASGYNLNKINSNFSTIAAALNEDVLYRDSPVGEPNALQTDVDCNSKNLYNIGDLRVLGTATINGTNFDTINSALIWRGAWSGATTYAVSDAVSYSGSSYIATQASTNTIPTNTTFWDVLAAEGLDGAPGAGTGDVVGPASAVNNRIALFNGATGKIIKDSGIDIGTVGGATGSGGDKVFYENDTVVTSNHTISRTSHTVGPLTVNTGVVLTISSGNRLVIL